ncbi:MAG: PTS fructose transporter subunit IIA [Lacrimispora sp.]|uniref:PTS sugar transporter subunit IIA n=1 Tax=Lacrimispora sp. TaxID=2719234 RepID=UPI0039E3574F
MEKPQVLLLTHGGWGMALTESLKMIMGSVDFVHEIALTPELTFSEYYALVDEFAAGLPEKSLILTDVFGGTTTNAGAKVGRDRNIKVISGLNAPLMLEACTQIKYMEDLNFDSVLQQGQASIIDVISEVTKSMEKKES